MKRTLRTGLAVLASAAVAGTTLSYAAPALASAGPGIFFEGDSCSGYTRNGTVNDPNHAPSAVNDTATVVQGGSVTIDVLANDTDPDGDATFVVSTSDPAHGYTCIVDDKVVYYSYGDAATSDTFSYAMTDGDYYRTATVSITINPIRKAKPKVVLTKQTSHGRVTRKGQVKVTNPDPDYPIVFYAGDFRHDDEPDIHRTIAPGGSTTVATSRSRLDFETVAQTGDDDTGDEEFEEGTLLYYGSINTLTGKVTTYDDEFRAGAARRQTAVRGWRSVR